MPSASLISQNAAFSILCVESQSPSPSPLLALSPSHRHPHPRPVSPSRLHPSCFFSPICAADVASCKTFVVCFMAFTITITITNTIPSPSIMFLQSYLCWFLFVLMMWLLAKRSLYVYYWHSPSLSPSLPHPSCFLISPICTGDMANIRSLWICWPTNPQRTYISHISSTNRTA